MAEVAAGTVGVAAVEAWLRAAAAAVHDAAPYLTELDAAIGDADHGINLDRGMSAVVAALDAADTGGGFADVETLAKKVGMTLVSTVGGASGPLYGTFFLRFAAAVPGAVELTAEQLGAAWRAGFGGVLARGKAEPGDKTMVDAWAPACTAYEEAVAGGARLGWALAAMATAAAAGRDVTEVLLARKGRASYLGERSMGHIDPGAASTALLLAAAVGTLAGDPAEPR